VLDRLEAAYAERATGVRWLKVEPIFDGQRGAARFRTLVSGIGIPD
jgi:hypothetical protein